ncbi:nucleoside deaminase [soil metagenome]
MNDKKFLRRSIELARESMEKGGFPAGAVIVKDGQVVAEGISIGNILHDPTSHAEIASIREACKQLGTADLRDSVLYESLQSCVMCLSAAYWAGVSKIVYGCKKTEALVKKGCYEGTTDNEVINKENSRQIELVYIPDFESQSQKLIENWEEKLS